MLKLVIPSDGPARLVKAVQNYIQPEQKNTELSEVTNLTDLQQEINISQGANKSTIKDLPKDYYSKWSWFIGGLLVGSFLNFFTVLVLVSIGVLIANEPLPVLGLPPQEAIGNIIRTVVRNSVAKDIPITTVKTKKE